MSAFTNTDFNFTGINHLALTCSDMRQTVGFYTNILGMKLGKTLEFTDDSESGQHFFFDVGNGRDAIAFFWFEDAPASAPGITQSRKWIDGAPRSARWIMWRWTCLAKRMKSIATVCEPKG